MGFWSLVVGLALISVPAIDADEALRSAYEQRKREATLSVASQVSLALWCEQNGLMAERNRHLRLAAQRDPDNAKVRSLLGQVRDGEGWRRADEPARNPEPDPIREDYRVRRGRMKDTAEAHEKLADWCGKNGLSDEADAHFRSALRIDANRVSVLKKLGYKKLGGRWLSDAQVAAEKADAEEQKRADEKWMPIVGKLKEDLRDPAAREAAEKALDEIDDPWAAPTIWRLFVLGKDRDPVRAIRLLSHLDDPAVSRILAMLAVWHDVAVVRNQAAQSLRGRDPREFAGGLVELLADPIKYEVRPVGGPGSPGVLFIEGESAYLRRSYAPPPAFSPAAFASPWVIGPNGLPAFFQTSYESELQYRSDLSASMRNAGMLEQAPTAVQRDFMLLRAEQQTRQILLESMKTAQVAQAQLASDVAVLNDRNEQIREINGRVRNVLGPLANLGADAGSDRWFAWYQDSIGYRYVPPAAGDKPVVDQPVPLAYQPLVPAGYSYNPLNGFTPDDAGVAPRLVVQFQRLEPFTPTRRRGHGFCFAAGTPVHTRDGLVPIERLRVGDQVLSLDTRAGSLCYKSVVTVLHNPPSELLKLRAGGEAVRATPIHPFWRAGRGWSMARDLAEGDLVRGIAGVHVLDQIDLAGVEPVFNLEVADTGTFFVGATGWLAHDNSIREPRGPIYDANPAADKAGVAAP